MEFYAALHNLEFAIPLAIPLNGGHALKNTQILDISDSAFPSVISIESIGTQGSCGSGVVISKRLTPIIIDGREYSSLALTAGHIIGKSIQINSLTDVVVLNSSSITRGKDYIACVLNDYSDIKDMPQYDPVSGIPYSLPNNLGLLALPKRFEAIIAPMPICDFIHANDQIFIAGYPLLPSSLSPLYCSPCLKNDPEYKTKISDAFCGYRKKVFSYGAAKHLRIENQYLLAAEYSSTSGMSGGPVYVMRHGLPQLVGINIGGCSLPYQFEIVKIIHEILIGDDATAKIMFNILMADIKASPVYNYSVVENNFYSIDKLDFSSNAGTACQYLICLLNTLSLAYVRPLDLSHNLSIPVWSSTFGEIKKAIRNFDSMPPNSSFLTPEDFFLELNK